MNPSANRKGNLWRSGRWRGERSKKNLNRTQPCAKNFIKRDVAFDAIYIRGFIRGNCRWDTLCYLNCGILGTHKHSNSLSAARFEREIHTSLLSGGKRWSFRRSTQIGHLPNVLTAGAANSVSAWLTTAADRPQLFIRRYLNGNQLNDEDVRVPSAELRLTEIGKRKMYQSFVLELWSK